MKPIQLDIEEAIRLKDEGMETATAHADTVTPEWRDIAYAFLQSRRLKGVFLVEDIRKAAEGIVPEPPDSRAWGSVIRRAAKAELVEKVGVQAKASAVCHRGFASLWQFKP
jgi:hypothetical protein